MAGAFHTVHAFVQVMCSVIRALSMKCLSDSPVPKARLWPAAMIAGAHFKTAAVALPAEVTTAGSASVTSAAPPRIQIDDVCSGKVLTNASGYRSSEGCWCGSNCHTCSYVSDMGVHEPKACRKCKNGLVLMKSAGVCVGEAECRKHGGKPDGKVSALFGRLCTEAVLRVTPPAQITGPRSYGLCRGKTLLDSSTSKTMSCRCQRDCHTCDFEMVGLRCHKCKNGALLLHGSCISIDGCVTAGGAPDSRTSSRFGRICHVADIGAPATAPSPTIAIGLGKTSTIPNAPMGYCTGRRLSNEKLSEANTACSCAKDCYRCAYDKVSRNPPLFFYLALLSQRHHLNNYISIQTKFTNHNVYHTPSLTAVAHFSCRSHQMQENVSNAKMEPFFEARLATVSPFSSVQTLAASLMVRREPALGEFVNDAWFCAPLIVNRQQQKGPLSSE